MSQPETSRQQMSRQETSRPETSRQETSRPETSRPEIVAAGPGGATSQVPAWGARGWTVLPRGFFDRPVLSVAPALLGCVLVHETRDGIVAVQLAEVEAYRGESDPASHAFRGQTARNAVMFGEPGHAYVYFTYGMHFCVNLVCQRPGEAAAVLLRAGGVAEGSDLAAARRGTRTMAGRELARGPARLCQALDIGRAQNGADVCDPRSPLRILAPAGFDGPPAAAVRSGPRVGVRLGAKDEWRFWVAGDPAVSAYRPHAARRRAAGAVISDVTRAPRDGSMQR